MTNTKKDPQAKAAPLLSIEKTAEILGMQTAAVYRLLKTGKIPGRVRLGDRAIRVNQAALAAYIEQGGTPEAAPRS